MDGDGLPNWEAGIEGIALVLQIRCIGLPPHDGSPSLSAPADSVARYASIEA